MELEVQVSQGELDPLEELVKGQMDAEEVH
jgi:hypothetical protein